MYLKNQRIKSGSPFIVHEVNKAVNPFNNTHGSIKYEEPKRLNVLPKKTIEPFKISEPKNYKPEISSDEIRGEKMIRNFDKRTEPFPERKEYHNPFSIEPFPEPILRYPKPINEKKIVHGVPYYPWKEHNITVPPLKYHNPFRIEPFPRPEPFPEPILRYPEPEPIKWHIEPFPKSEPGNYHQINCSVLKTCPNGERVSVCDQCPNESDHIGGGSPLGGGIGALLMLLPFL